MTHLLCWSDSDFRAQPVSPDYCRTLLAHMQLLVPRFSSARSKKTSARGQHIWAPFLSQLLANPQPQPHGSAAKYCFYLRLVPSRHYVFENRPFLFGNIPFASRRQFAGSRQAFAHAALSLRKPARRTPYFGTPGTFVTPGTPGAPGAFGAGAPGALGAAGAPGALGAVGGLPMSDGSNTSAPGTPGAFGSGMSGSTLSRSCPHAGHSVTVASLTSPHSGQVLFNTKLAGLKHISASIPPHESGHVPAWGPTAHAPVKPHAPSAMPAEPGTRPRTSRHTLARPAGRRPRPRTSRGVPPASAASSS